MTHTYESPGFPERFTTSSLLYESPYTDEHPLGVCGLFTKEQFSEIRSVLDFVRERAAA